MDSVTVKKELEIVMLCGSKMSQSVYVSSLTPVKFS